MNAVSHASRIVVIRASALPDFLDCPARAEAKHLLGKQCPTTGKALLGKAVHRATAVYDESVITGKGIKIDEAAGAAVDVFQKPDEDVAFDEGENPRELERIAISLHTKYCKSIAPTREYVAVEVHCERVDITDIGIALTGTTDRVRKVNGGHGISDLKTGKSAVRSDGHVETKGHAYQLGVYEILAEHALGIRITEKAEIIGLQTNKTEDKQRVATGECDRPRDVLIGERGSIGVLASMRP